MIEMKVMGIALDTRTGSPIVVLHDKEKQKSSSDMDWVCRGQCNYQKN